jgi:hypothetical protein
MGIKLNENLEVAEQELDVSDLIWEGVLSRADYLEHFFKKQYLLFKVLIPMYIQLS